MRSGGIYGPNFVPEFKLDIFESWLELSTAPIFQMHTLTDACRALLERGRYTPPVNTNSTKALLVRSARRRVDEDGRRHLTFGEPLCISIKFPPAREIVARRGVLAYEEPNNEPRPEGQPMLPLDGVPAFGEPARAGLILDRGHRVLSLTAERVRVFATGQIVASYECGEHDRRNPDAGVTIPDDTAEALATLIP